MATKIQKVLKEVEETLSIYSAHKFMFDLKQTDEFSFIIIKSDLNCFSEVVILDLIEIRKKYKASSFTIMNNEACISFVK